MSVTPSATTRCVGRRVVSSASYEVPDLTTRLRVAADRGVVRFVLEIRAGLQRSTKRRRDACVQKLAGVATFYVCYVCAAEQGPDAVPGEASMTIRSHSLTAPTSAARRRPTTWNSASLSGVVASFRAAPRRALSHADSQRYPSPSLTLTAGLTAREKPQRSDALPQAPHLRRRLSHVDQRLNSLDGKH